MTLIEKGKHHIWDRAKRANGTFATLGDLKPTKLFLLGGYFDPPESRRELRENDFRYARDFLEVLLKFRELPIDKKIGVAPPIF